MPASGRLRTWLEDVAKPTIRVSTYDSYQDIVELHLSRHSRGEVAHSVEPLRRVDEGAQPVEGWDGPPWAPDGCGTYEPDGRGMWWPTEEAIRAGFTPCRACRR